MNDAAIRISLLGEPHPLRSINESRTEWWLGHVGINKHVPLFRTGFHHELRPKARFTKQAFAFDHRRGIAVSFQAPRPGAQAEHFVGWVNRAQEHQLDEWLAFMNLQIHNRFEDTQGVHITCKFAELGFAGAPSLRDARGKRSPHHKELVVRYLRTAEPIVRSDAFYADAFDPGIFADRKTIVTDGVFAWPAVMAYYVDHHDLALPVPFELHMKMMGWRLPDLGATTLRLPLRREDQWLLVG